MSVDISIEDIASHAADTLLPPDPLHADYYRESVERGRHHASRSRVAFVAICRNAMPWLPRTLALVEQTASYFRDSSVFIYENDSEDETKEVLLDWHDRDPGRRRMMLNTHGRPHLNWTTATVRTTALAEYRAACQNQVRVTNPTADYVIVFDTDPWGGWSVDGVLSSIGHLAAGMWYGLASYSWAESMPPNVMPIHYDAFAARLNHWEQRDQNWFHLWHPPVGSPPVSFRSAFGQLAVYRATPYLSGTYTGEDCEHVTFHKSISRRFISEQFGLNPSMRCVSFWRQPRGG